MSPTPTASKRLAIACPPLCSLHPDKIGQKAADALAAARANGAGSRVMCRRAEELLGRPVVASSMDRHLKHYRELKDEEPTDMSNAPRPTDLAILDAIIVSGYRNSRNWKPSIKDTLDAMKLKVQMTGQSAFEDMITAMDAALDLADGEGDADGEEEAEEVENVEAVLSPEERVDAGE